MGFSFAADDPFRLGSRREEGAYREYATDEQRRLDEKRPTAMVMNGENDPRKVTL